MARYVLKRLLMMVVVVLGISFPRYSRRTIEAMNYAKGKGATVVSLTDTPSVSYTHLTLPTT